MHDLEQRILRYLSKADSKPVRASALAKKLKVGEGQRVDFGEALNRLLESRQVVGKVLLSPL